MDKTKRICLWSGPRNISTALMYSFAQRKDTTVVDEPLYAHYLTSTDADEYHPGAEDVIADQHNDGERVVREVILGDYETPVVFFKHMTHHLVDLDWSFMKDTINLILTRDPRDMLPSYAKQVNQPAMRDVGYAKHLELLEYLQSIGQQPMVIDSKQVLMDPKGKLTEICHGLGIPFDEAMLSWEAGARPEDGVWADHWYHNVHRSTGFKPYTPKTEPFPEHLKELLKECQPIYHRLIGKS
ncbi:sulfotransferase family protein [Aliifodinibius sp. S!AR15-10]|uniref:sulfotransferase-like domain-containing protein n=1 Tax=Aliifodinibius sp. S!AR15-10 TaxID=2950437 RepID=UPI00285D2E7F|nr:sulfotransferase family protein [Aliifodinibius sp. S!AR15-10]MDR8393937.1 sulfotransferase family protein [Aliifodinibius sp. S!AR15-10]